MILLENIKVISGQSITMHKIRKFMTVRDRDREPEKRVFTDLTPQEIMEHSRQMMADLNKIAGFVKQLTATA
jgi:ribosomal protein L11